MRPLLAALALILLAAAPARAQTPPAPCPALFKATGFLSRTPDTGVEAHDQGCRFTNAIINLGSHARFAVREISLDGPDVMAAIARHAAPTSIDLWVRGLRLAPEIEGSPLANYILELQQEPYDLHLAINWDKATGVLDITQASLASARLGVITVSARLAGVLELPDDLAHAPDALTTASLEQVDIDLDNRGLFTALFAAPLLGVLPPDQDPRPTIAAVQNLVTTTIAATPDARLSAPSKAALTQFVTDFPRPDGHYAFALRPISPPLTMDQLSALADMNLLANVLTQIAVTARLVPEPSP